MEEDSPMQIKSNGYRMARKTKAIPKRVAVRRRLPASDYVFPDDEAYPIPDAYHAGLALQALLRTAGRHGIDEPSRERASKVLGAVRKRFPGIYDGEHNLVVAVRRRYGLRHPVHGGKEPGKLSSVDSLIGRYDR
jgi:hypothetical protein